MVRISSISGHFSSGYNKFKFNLLRICWISHLLAAIACLFGHIVRLISSIYGLIVMLVADITHVNFLGPIAHPSIVVSKVFSFNSIWNEPIKLPVFLIKCKAIMGICLCWIEQTLCIWNKVQIFEGSGEYFTIMFLMLVITAVGFVCAHTFYLDCTGNFSMGGPSFCCVHNNCCLFIAAFIMNAAIIKLQLLQEI